MHDGYGFWRFVLDFILICLTGGLWFLWIVLKYLRKNS